MKHLIFGIIFLFFVFFSSGCAPREEPWPYHQHPGGEACLKEDLSPSEEQRCRRLLLGP